LHHSLPLNDSAEKTLMNQKGKKSFVFFNVHGSVHFKNILIHIQQDTTLHNLFYLETALHVSGGTTTHHQERKQLYPQHLVFVTRLLLPTAIAVAVTALQITDAVDTVVCAPDVGWWYHPKHVKQFPDKINCVTLHLVGYILEKSFGNITS
jgi:hypothetical protein